MTEEEVGIGSGKGGSEEKQVDDKNDSAATAKRVKLPPLHPESPTCMPSSNSKEAGSTVPSSMTKAAPSSTSKPAFIRPEQAFYLTNAARKTSSGVPLSRIESEKRMRSASEKRANFFKKWLSGESRPFAIMMTLTTIYLIAELAMSLITGYVYVFLYVGL